MGFPLLPGNCGASAVVVFLRGKKEFGGGNLLLLCGGGVVCCGIGICMCFGAILVRRQKEAVWGKGLGGV